jgi:FAD binding domain/Berberine and berberine like
MEGSTESFARELKAVFKGELLLPADTDYSEARRVWNALVDRNPAVIARCRNVSDVQTAIRVASAAGMPTAVRCGGHSLAGFGSCDNGLVLDLSGMRGILIDENRRRAYVQGGCLLSTIDTATQKLGLAFPAGVVSHTGAAGLILGGGTGWLTRRFGMSCDNVERFTLVAADASLVRASARENTDLFWALRGGGGNFGVVTEFVLKLHPLRSVLLGSGTYFGEDMAGVLRYWRDFMPEAPEDLKWNFSLQLSSGSTTNPRTCDYRPALTETIAWLGDKTSGGHSFDRILSLGNPTCVKRETLSFLELQTMADREFPGGRRYYTKSGYFRTLDDNSIQQMIGALDSIPSPRSQIELAYLGGAAARVSPSKTAFGSREAPYIVNILGNWEPASADAENIDWVRTLFAKLRPAMAPGVYINFMSADEEDRVQEAYRGRWNRLVAVKTHYDPGNFFRLNQNIPPRRSSSDTRREKREDYPA